MTISVQTPRSGPYSGDGGTVAFSYAFLIDDEAELVVQVLDSVTEAIVVKTLATDYTVSGVGAIGGGEVTFLTAPTSTEQVVVLRETVLDQGLDLQNRGAVVPQLVEDGFDELTKMVQDIDERLDRAVVLDAFDTTSGAQFVIDVAAAGAYAAAAAASADVAALYDGTWFDSVPLLLADTTLTYTAATPTTVVTGDYVVTRKDGFTYEVAASGAADHHVTTAGGVKLYVLPKDGAYYDIQFGITGDVAGEEVALKAAWAVAENAYFYVTQKIYVATPSLTALQTPSNITIEFINEGEIELLAHNTDTYAIINLTDVGNVTLINPKVNGRKDLNSAVSGEQGHGINIRGATGKILVVDAQTYNCWGDGMYIGAATQTWCEDVHIVRHKADGCRRQGMSIISAKRLIVDQPQWKNTAGANPQKGCDIEPNNNDDFLEFIRINEPYTENCFFGGIGITLVNFGGATTKLIDIQITGHHDVGSGAAPFRVNGLDPAASIYGSIRVVKPTYHSLVGNAFRSVDWGNGGVELLIDQPTIIGPSTGVSQINNSLFVFNSEIAAYEQGGVTINKPHMRLAGRTFTEEALIVVDDGATGATFAGIKIIEPEGDQIKSSYMTLFGNPAEIVTDPDNETWSRDYSTSDTIQNAAYVRHTRATTSILTLVSGNLGDTAITVKVAGVGNLQLKPPAGGKFLHLTTDDYFICAGAIGSVMRVTPLGGGVWRQDYVAGPWTVTVVP